MSSLGNIERKYEADKMRKGISIILGIIFAFVCISNMHYIYILMGSDIGGFVVIMLVCDIIAVICEFLGLRTHLLICENGIEGRAGFTGGNEVILSYSEIQSVEYKNKECIVVAKDGNIYHFKLKDGLACTHEIKAKIENIHD